MWDHFMIYIFLSYKMASRRKFFFLSSVHKCPNFYHSTKYPLGFQGPMIRHCSSIHSQYWCPWIKVLPCELSLTQCKANYLLWLHILVAYSYPHSLLECGTGGRGTQDIICMRHTHTQSWTAAWFLLLTRHKNGFPKQENLEDLISIDYLKNLTYVCGCPLWF